MSTKLLKRIPDFEQFKKVLKREGKPNTLRYSNFRWYEDRETGDIVLYVTPCGGEGEGVNSHSYRCNIELPV